MSCRAGITGEVKLEYVIVNAGWADTDSVRVIGSTDPAFAVSSIEAVLGASFKPALRAGGRWRRWCVKQFDFRTANPVVIELSSSGEHDVAGPPYFRDTITLPLEVVACSRT